MRRLQAYKYEILPNGEQERRMRRCAGSCRFVFNKALALQKERYERGEKKLSYAGLCQCLTQWRNGTETPWLADAPTHPLQQALKDLERLPELLCAPCALPALQAQGTARALSLPRCATIQGRPDQRPALPAEARLASIPQQPGDAGRGEEHHLKRVLRPVVRQHPDRTGSRGARPE